MSMSGSSHLMGLAAVLAQSAGFLPPPPTPPEPPIGVNVPAIHATCKLLTAAGEVIVATVDTSAYSSSDSNGSWKQFVINSDQKLPFDSKLYGEMKYRDFDDGINNFNIMALAQRMGGDDYFVKLTAYRHSDSFISIYRIEHVKVSENQSIGRNHYYASGYCRSSFNTERK